MEKLKEIMTSPKKTAFLGLIGGFIMLFCTILDIDYINTYSLVFSVFILGIIAYFVIVLLRITKHNVSINIANCLLILTFVVSFLCGIFVGISQGEGIVLFDFVLLISALYFCNIFLIKSRLINNKIFVIPVIVCLVYELITNGTYILRSDEIVFSDLIYFIKYIGYILILPYFYNYYNLLKKEEK